MTGPFDNSFSGRKIIIVHCKRHHDADLQVVQMYIGVFPLFGAVPKSLARSIAFGDVESHTTKSYRS